MQRRQFIKLAGFSTLGLASGGAIWLSIGNTSEPLTIDSALVKLSALSVTPLQHSGQWPIAKIFTHCAQSIEYSMLGYPEHKSALFKQTVGVAAFSVFSAKGAMVHNLSEAIPGAPSLPTDNNINKATERLVKAFKDFQAYQGALAPHFAYGPLTKAEYALAHVLHFFNHLEEVSILA
ncbi:DUF1569 domain-containing protein [Thalassotalea sp. PLHSN55]|uniref:DUF1569 domain-containing protein n=1 Tax=Thalassotalea sp. PLHSN55 TaxID=3435888 RepID=UPI003F8241D9